MTDKARELLERAIEEWDSDRDLYEFHEVMEEIRTYLVEPEVKPQPFNQAEFDEMVRKGTEAWKDYKPEVKREALSDGEISKGWWAGPDFIDLGAFSLGVRFAEKHHGIGGEDE